MASVNKVILIGNLGADPEVRFTQGGQAVGNFRIACSESWTDKGSGQRQERTEWVRIVVWGKQAESCGEYLQKGRQVYVEGRLQTREWTDKENRKNWTTEVVANQVVFLGSGQGQGTGGERSSSGQGDDEFGPLPAYDDERGQGGSAPSGAVFPPYGRSKGAPVAGASVEDLEYYAKGCRRNLEDPSKSRWHDKERELLAAIEAELARKGSGSSGAPASSGGYGGPSDDDIPF